MTSNLPSRWQEILRREAADNVGQVLAQARNQPPPRRLPRWTVPAAAVAVGSFSLLNLLGSSEAKSGGSVPFDRSAVISTRTAGLGANAEDLAPAKKAIDATPTTAPTPAPTPPALELPARKRLAPSTPKPARRSSDYEKRQIAEKPPEPEPTPATPEPPPVTLPPKPPPVVVNVGTRLQAILTDPVITGAALAPATAKLAADFFVGDRLVIPEGTPLVGEGFATQQDDRVQVVFSAFVREGKTLQFEGWALQNSEMGIAGKLIRKGSKVKSGSGTVLGAAASALTFGLAGAAGGPAGAAFSNLGSTVGSDLNRLGRDWRLSDKAVRVEAGVPIIVYVRRDLTIE
jgi:hypothetical protein